MRPRAGTGPAGALPSLHAPELGGLVQLHDAVDLAVGVSVVLAPVDLAAVHEDGGDAEVPRLLAGGADPAAAVLGAVELRLRDPTFLQALLDEGAYVFIVGVAGAVGLIEASLEVFARGAGIVRGR
jgi:hypothetical protein